MINKYPKIMIIFLTIGLSAVLIVPDGNTADFLVGSAYTDQILRYDGQTGAFVGVFIEHPQLDLPAVMVFGPDGNLYVGSPPNNSILRFNPQTGAFIDIFIAPGSGGLTWPLGMVFGPDGNLYVCSQHTSQILRYHGQTGAFIDVFAEGNGLDQPVGLAFGPDGHLYVPSFRSHQVLRYDGQTGAYIDEFIDDTHLYFPSSLIFRPDGRIYIDHSDPNSGPFEESDGRIIRFDAQTGAFIDVIVPYGNDLNGTPIFGPDNNIYIGSFYKNKVMRFDGSIGAFIDNFVAPDSGGLDGVGFLAFFPLDPTPPFAEMSDPADGATNVPVDTNIEVHVSDAVSGVDLSTVVLTLNGIVAYDGSNPGAYPDTTVTGDTSAYQLIYNPPTDFDNEIVVNVTVSGSDQEGNSTTADFSFQTESLAGNPWDPIGDEDGDGIPNGEEDANGNGTVDTGETDPERKTLFVRPTMVNAALTAFVYWPRFLELFPSARDGFAEIPALSEADIEVVVIGDPRHIYAPWTNFNHNPANDSVRPQVDIMEIVYYDDRFASCNDFSDCENNDGHIYFDDGLDPNSLGVPQWLFDIMGYTPGSPVPIQGYTHRYRTPRIYQKVIDNYLNQGAYAQIEVNEVPETTVCASGQCGQDGSNDTSAFNLLDGEGGPPFAGAPDATGEFNDITYDATGRITNVGANDKKRYNENATMRRVLVHEIGHGLNLVDHCWNPFCIMYSLVPSWELYGYDSQSVYGFGSSGIGADGQPTQCEHSPNNSGDIRLDYDPTVGRNTGVFNSVH